MWLLYSILAVILVTLIEAWRINRRRGEVTNINKMGTYGISLAFYFSILWLLYGQNFGYIDETPPIHEILYLTAFLLSLRGVVYDPLLNVLRELPIDKESVTTNSILDWFEINVIKLSFWNQRLIYFVVMLIFGILYANQR